MAPPSRLPMLKRVYYFEPCPLAPVLRQLGRVGTGRRSRKGKTAPDAYEVIPIDRKGGERPRWELPAVIIADAGEDELARIEKIAPEEDEWRVIYLLRGASTPWFGSSQRVFAFLPERVPLVVIEKALERAFESLRHVAERKQARRELNRAAADLEALNKIGVALSAERDPDALLQLIVAKSREITGSDAGSLYLVEEKPDGTKHLVFKLMQSDTREFLVRPHSLPINKESMAGHAVATERLRNIKDAYRRIPNLPFPLNGDFDREFNYQTKSMLVVPMKNQKDEVIGVLELLNAKKRAEARLVSDARVEQEVISFSKHSEQLAESLASQAAVALENNRLYRDIQNQFEGFVRASIKAIELRDPTTSGHSERVAALTVRLAEVVDRATIGPYAEVSFSPGDLQELKYASLLHDFGKVGVREHLLVKAKKLIRRNGSSSRSASSQPEEGSSSKAPERSSIISCATEGRVSSRFLPPSTGPGKKTSRGCGDSWNSSCASTNPRACRTALPKNWPKLRRPLSPASRASRNRCWRRRRSAFFPFRAARWTTRSAPRSSRTSSTATNSSGKFRGRRNSSASRRSLEPITRSSTAPATRTTSRATRFRVRRR